jgi:putative membrane protein
MIMIAAAGVAEVAAGAAEEVVDFLAVAAHLAAAALLAVGKGALNIMAKTFHMTAADHAHVTASVAAAEAHTDGEIVTVVTGLSDQYHDVGLHVAIAAMIAMHAAVIGWPGWFANRLNDILGTWHGTLAIWQYLAGLLCLQIIAFLVFRYAFAWMPLRLAITPKATKARRVRRQALQAFRMGAEARTVRKTGVLIYLSLGEHQAEIIADESIHSKVAPEIWGDAMAALIVQVKAGKPAEGIADAVQIVGAILAKHFPRGAGDINELPDRLIEL